MNYDRIILELMDRVSVLEDEVKQLKEAQSQTESGIETVSVQAGLTGNSSGRDTTKFILDGKKYGKNRLVLAVVKKYMEMHPDTTAAKLMMTFDKSLQGSLGVVRTLDDVENSYSDYKTRFFAAPDELIKTQTDVCVVCTQWGIANIGNLVVRAEQLGIDIKIVK